MQISIISKGSWQEILKWKSPAKFRISWRDWKHDKQFVSLVGKSKRNKENYQLRMGKSRF